VIALASARGVSAEPFAPLGETPSGEVLLRVYLVRHAQAWKNVSALLRPPGMSAEKLDSLTGKGREQARAVGERLRGAGVARIVSSPAQRARQTAEGIAGGLGADGVPVEPSEAFQPLRHGSSADAARYRWRTGNWRRGEDPRPEGGESLGDGLARAVAYLEAAARETPGATLVVVSHGEISAALLSHAAGVSPLTGYEQHFVREGTLSEIALTPTGFELLAEDVKP